jgi:tetratricopeptide (TPR) repeat protein
LVDHQNADALADFRIALQYPENLHAEPREGAVPRQSEVSYWVGAAQAALGDTEKSRQSWTEAADASSRRERRGAGDVSERRIQRSYQALSLRKLGRDDQAKPIFRDLIDASASALKDLAPERFKDSLSVSERQSRRHRAGTAHYLAALGHLGLDEKEDARRELREALEVSPDHLGAKTALAELR